jgi:hypothetical protein
MHATALGSCSNHRAVSTIRRYYQGLIDFTIIQRFGNSASSCISWRSFLLLWAFSAIMGATGYEMHLVQYL